MLAEVAHFGLKPAWVAGSIREHPPLQMLDQDRFLDAANARDRPIWLGDRVAEREEPVVRLALEETPEGIWNVMSQFRLIDGDTCLGPGTRGVIAELPTMIDGSCNIRPDA